MTGWQELADGLFVRPSALYQTQTVLIRDPDAIWVADPNFFPEEIRKARARAEEEAPPARPGRLLLTHSDFDHVLGAHAFRDYETYASASWSEANERAGRAHARAFDEEHYIRRSPEAYLPARRDVAVRRDGETYGGLTFHLAPGHQVDGLFALHERTSTLLVGDYLSELEFPFVDAGFAAYVTTFLKMARILRARNVLRVVPGHGPVASGQAAWSRRLRDDAAYLLALLDAAERARAAHGDHPHLPKVVAAETLLAHRGEPFSPSLYGCHETNAKMALAAQADGGVPDHERRALQALASP